MRNNPGGTGIRVPVWRIDNPANRNFGFAFDMTETFVRNEYADAFKLEF